MANYFLSDDTVIGTKIREASAEQQVTIINEVARELSESISKELNELSAARKILVCDILSPENNPIYMTDAYSVIWVFSPALVKPVAVAGFDKITVPMFNIATNPTVQVFDDKITIRDLKDRAISSMCTQEGFRILQMLDCAVPNRHTFTTKTLNAEIFKKAVIAVAEHEVKTRYITMSKIRFDKIVKSLENGDFEKDPHYCKNDIIIEDKEMRKGTWLGIEMLIVPECPDSCMFLTAEADRIGVISVKHGVMATSSDEAKKVRYGWVAAESIGMVIMNDYTISKINIEE